MVHALEAIHRLLKPDGSLIDIHPLPDAPLIEVHQGGTIVFTEPVPEHDVEDIQQAEEALARVAERGLFVIDQSTIFDFLTYGSSVAALRDFLAESSAFKVSRPEAAKEWELELTELVEEVMRTAGEGAEVAFHERALITRLAPGHAFSPPDVSYTG